MVDLIPTMTSNTTPEGVASASSVYENNTSLYGAWKAFDKVITGFGWVSQTPTAWLQYQFSSSQKINEYTIRATSYVTELNWSPNTWEFKGSNNGTDWDVLDTRSNETGWTVSQQRIYSFINDTEYLYYRIDISANDGGYYIIINEMEMGFTINPNVITGNGLIELILSSRIIPEKITGAGLIEFIGQSSVLRSYLITGDGKIEFNLSSILNILKELLFNTNLATRLLKSKIISAILNTCIRSFKKINTDLRIAVYKFNKFNTELRIRKENYDFIQPGKLTDIIVKKDGTELIDVDYSTLKITYRMNRTPSQAVFTLARHHDKFDYTLPTIENPEGIYSQITNENKIQIYDKDRLLFTGYITQLQAKSETDTIDVTAEDIRYKINKKSIKIYYGGYTQEMIEEQELTGQIYSSTKDAIIKIFGEIGSLISGYDTVDFGFIPEPTEGYNSCGTLLDTLITNSANIKWYTDENERIRFQKVGIGNKKSLSLSSLDKRRHIYDVIANNITLNRQTEDYYTSFEIKFGKEYRKLYTRGSGAGLSLNWLAIQEATKLAKDYQSFAFQSMVGSGTWYCGQVDKVYGYHAITKILSGWFIYQWLAEDKYYDIAPIVVGMGEPQKILYLTSYGRKYTNLKWEHRSDDDWSLGYLWETSEDRYDYTGYAIDLAKFDLSQNNKLITESTITLLLDAFEYYNISFQNLINLNNTIQPNIYNDNNGFPLNISEITIDCSTRIVTLDLTNYGKTYFQRSNSYLDNYISAEERRTWKAHPVVQMSGGY